MIRLNRFATRFAIALVIAAFVLLAHERHHLQLLQVSACAALLIWAVAELGHAYRRRRHGSRSLGSSRS